MLQEGRCRAVSARRESACKPTSLAQLATFRFERAPLQTINSGRDRYLLIITTTPSTPRHNPHNTTTINKDTWIKGKLLQSENLSNDN